MLNGKFYRGNRTARISRVKLHKFDAIKHKACTPGDTYLAAPLQVVAVAHGLDQQSFRHQAQARGNHGEIGFEVAAKTVRKRPGAM